MTPKKMEDTEPCVLCGNEPDDCVCMPDDMDDITNLDALAEEADWNYYEEMSKPQHGTTDTALNKIGGG